MLQHSQTLALLFFSKLSTNLTVLGREPAAGQVMLLTGGFSAAGNLASVEVVGREECRVADLPGPRSGHATLLTAEGELLTCGGSDRSGAAAALDCLALNVSGQAWAQHSPLTSSRIHSSAVSLPWGSLLLGGWGAARTSSLLLPRFLPHSPLSLTAIVQGKEALGGGATTAREWLPLLLQCAQSCWRIPPGWGHLLPQPGGSLVQYSQVAV